MTSIETVMQAVVDGARTAQEIHKRTGINPATVKSSLTTLKRDGLVRVTQVDQHNTFTYAPTQRGMTAAQVTAEQIAVADEADDEPHRVCVAPAGFVERAISLRSPLEVAWLGR